MGEEENGEVIQMTSEQIAEMIEAETIQTNRQYIEQMKKALSFIDELEKKPDRDRLRYANMISQLIGIMIGSIKGWQNWLNFNSMDNLLSLKELEEIAPKIKELVKEWIEIDIAITESKTKDVEVKHEETKTKAKTKTSKQTKSYVT